MKEDKNFRKRPEPARPNFPKRAVITAGMPYGNKELHFGHIGGVFIHADVFARFLRDRIGNDNVIFVSGTDCYGSPILESYRKACEDEGYKGTIEEYVTENHNKQKKTLDDYDIDLNLYATSAFGRSGQVHEKVSEEVFELLYEKGYLDKLSTPQLFDPDFQVILNGRQVIGECPIEGCRSDKAYADECALGHQYMPTELINPKSTLSGKTPEITNVTNWYFKMDQFQKLLSERIDYLRKNTNSRKYLLNTMEEFLRDPMIYIKKNQLPKLKEILDKLPEHEYIEEEKKPSVTLVFKTLKGREEATEIISSHGINFRTGKTLVPFRLTGNIEWGVKTPVKEGLEDLTFWVWPESLWAPISFTRTYLEDGEASTKDWKDWWCSTDANVYQFIGEDNIYFYGIAEMAMFMALQKETPDKTPDVVPKDGDLLLPHLIANNHVLFMDKKASSSSEIKPPMASELLDYYTNEQLRMHFISFGLDKNSVSFQPAVYRTEEIEGIDPVLKEGNLLTNVYNRLIRSCFYTSQKYYDSHIPEGKVSDNILEEAKKVILNYERHMYNHQFHRISDLLDVYVRKSNKYYVNNIRTADEKDDDELRRQVLIDSFHAVRVAATLVHPLAPKGADMVREYFGVDERIWSWDYIFEPLDYFIPNIKEHQVKFLEPRIDFFKKHDSQLEQ